MPVASSLYSSIWSECVQGYQWPEDVKSALLGGEAFSFDESHLLKLAAGAPRRGYFLLTFLSSEYLPLGLQWAQFALKAGLRRFAIAAMDAKTGEELRKRAIPVAEVRLPSALAKVAHYRNPGGFSGKALALIYCRVRLIKFLVDNRINALSSDIDALITKDPGPHLDRSPAIAFQRVMGFARPLARIWGFTACAGFVAYRASPDVSAVLSRVLSIQQDVSCDQLALNLALLEDQVRWRFNCHRFETDQRLVDDFTAQAGQSIYGHLPGTHINLEALPATTFWRHSFVPLNRRASVILHPNSPKSVEGKLDIFAKILGKGEMCLPSDQS